MIKPSILVIDDEAQMRRLLDITLQLQGYSVSQASTAKEGLIMAANHPPDLIIMDLGLPDKSGLEVLTSLRQWYTAPVMILSVQHDEEAIVTALDKGANDYLSKPFRTRELLARIRSALRTAQTEESDPIIGGAELEIDLAARTVKKNNDPIKLTQTEYSLLALLARNEGKVLTHQYLLRAIWGPGYISQSQYLRVYIAQLRKKIEKDPNRPEFILTESGVGYRFICK